MVACVQTCVPPTPAVSVLSSAQFVGYTTFQSWSLMGLLKWVATVTAVCSMSTHNSRIRHCFLVPRAEFHAQVPLPD